MPQDGPARLATAAMNGKARDGREPRVNEARTRAERGGLRGERVAQSGVAASAALAPSRPGRRDEPRGTVKGSRETHEELSAMDCILSAARQQGFEITCSSDFR